MCIILCFDNASALHQERERRFPGSQWTAVQAVLVVTTVADWVCLLSVVWGLIVGELYRSPPGQGTHFLLTYGIYSKVHHVVNQLAQHFWKKNAGKVLFRLYLKPVRRARRLDLFCGLTVTAIQ